MKKTILCILVGIIVTAGAFALFSYYFPGESFDPAIPSPEEFLGYPIGDWHNRYDLIVKYYEKLDAISELAELKTIGYT